MSSLLVVLLFLFRVQVKPQTGSHTHAYIRIHDNSGSPPAEVMLLRVAVYSQFMLIERRKIPDFLAQSVTTVAQLLALIFVLFQKNEEGTNCFDFRC